MPCKKKCCCKVECEDKSQNKRGCKFDCESILNKSTTTRPTDPMMDYGATVRSTGYRALIPYNHLSNQVAQLVSTTDPHAMVLEDISLGILISMSQIRIRRLVVQVTNPPTVPVTFQVYRRDSGRSLREFGLLMATGVQVTLLPGRKSAVGEGVTFTDLESQILVLVEPTSPPQNLGYVTASIAYEETQF